MNSYEEWYARGVELSRIYHDTRIAIADWLVEGENRFPETYAQAVDVLKLNPDTVSNYMTAARRCPPSVRPESDPDGKITISALQAVAPLYGYPQAQGDLLNGLVTGAIADRDVLRKEVSKLLAVIYPVNEDTPPAADSEPDATPTEPTWMDYEALEVASGDIGGLWSKIMKLLVAIKGQRVRLVIQVAAVQRTVDETTGEITDVS